jgi:gliding motility-associated-like protein
VNGATSAPATVTVTVTPVNDPPVAVDDQVATDENTAVDVPILSNDYDIDGDVIASSAVITTDPIHGVVTVNTTTGMATYTPEKDFIGNDSFAYTIEDAEGLTSFPATVTVNVVEVPNRPPNAVDDGPIENSFLTPIVIDVLANDTDEDNDELSLVSVTNPSMGTVTIVNGQIEYQAADLTSGIVTFTYTIQDPSGLTDEAVVTIENSFPPLTVSEGFSPNNDSNNETWYILGIEYYPDNSVRVYDRWGFLVYQKQYYENSAAPWDGRGNVDQHAGKLLDQGTYYYILEPGSEMKTMTGYVVIVR